MTKKFSVQMKDRAFAGTELISIIAFLRDFKATCHAGNNHEGAALWLCKQFLTGLFKAVIKAQVALPTKTINGQEGCLTSYSTVIKSLLKQYETDGGIAEVDCDIQQF